jgi:hypothetical protein
MMKNKWSKDETAGKLKPALPGWRFAAAPHLDLLKYTVNNSNFRYLLHVASPFVAAS